MQNKAISELYSDHNKWKYSSNIKDIPKSAKKFYEKLYTEETISKAAIAEFLNKIPNRKKISNEQFDLCEVKTSLDEFITMVCLTAEFCIHFSNKLAPVHLDVYMTPGESLVPWVLLPEQESYPSYKSWEKRSCKVQTHFTFKLRL